MTAWKKSKKRSVLAWRERDLGPVHVSRAIQSMVGRLDGEEGFELGRLWRRWPEVLGEHISAMARPVGHRGRTLLLGAEDPVVMQELSYFSDQIVERVNRFMGRKLFDKVAFELISGLVPLDDSRPVKRERVVRRSPEAPENLGNLTHLLEEDSPIGRSYRAYVRWLGPRGGEADEK